MRRIIPAFVVVALIGCGGGGGGGDSDVPKLSKPTGALSADVTLNTTCRAQGFAFAFSATANFAGDVVGGTLNTFATLNPVGTTFNASNAIPSTGVGVSGSTLEYRACITPGVNTSMTLAMQAVSPSGVSGNRVETTFSFF